MKYRVRWKRSALHELADIWTKATSKDRHAITNAVHSIERELAATADEAGESRSGGERIAFSAPVALVFAVSATCLFYRFGVIRPNAYPMLAGNRH